MGEYAEYPTDEEIKKANQTKAEKVSDIVGNCYELSLSSSPKTAMNYNAGSEVSINASTANTVIKVVPALSGTKDGVSLEVAAIPDLHIRHAGFVMWAHRGTDNLYKQDSSFNVEFDSGNLKFNSVNYPGYYISTQPDNRVKIIKSDSNNVWIPKQVQCPK
jgi:hypothetical protein